MPYNARRLCEVFCILQNLQMYEVPERASDGKASGRCDGSPKGFRHIVSGLCEEADFGAQNCQHTTKVDARYNVQLTTEPAFLQNRCYRFGVLSFGIVFCVGKDILFDKFWLVRLAFVRLGNVYGFWGGNIY